MVQDTVKDRPPYYPYASAEEQRNDAYNMKAEEFMGHLLSAGFEVQSVLEHGFTYMHWFSLHTGNADSQLFAAEIVEQAAKNMGIDRAGQYEASRKVNALRK